MKMTMMKLPSAPVPNLYTQSMLREVLYLRWSCIVFTLIMPLHVRMSMPCLSVAIATIGLHNEPQLVFLLANNSSFHGSMFSVIPLDIDSSISYGKLNTLWINQVGSMKRAKQIRDQLEGLLARVGIHVCSNANDLVAIKKAITSGTVLLDNINSVA